MSAVTHPIGIPRSANEPSFDVLLFDAGADAAATEQWLRGTGSVRVAREVEPAAALQRLVERQWDLLVVDPSTAGALDVATQARRRNRWAAVLATLADANPELMQRIVEQRIDGLVFKPLERQALIGQALALASQSRERRLREQKRVLAIGAHPDDVELACGGTLARHVAEADLVKILILSRGSAGGDVNLRLREAQRAADLLGASLEVGDLGDARVPEGGLTVSLIERVVRELKPTHVYTHALEDTQQDNRAAHLATLVAARDVPNVYCYQAASSTVEFTPNYYVDISGFMEPKLQAVGAYASEDERGGRLSPESIRAAAAFWGRHAGHALAEPLRVIRQHKFSPAPETPTQR